MGDKTLHAEADEPEKASYSVLKYRASELPEIYQNMILAKYMRTLRSYNDFFKLIEPKAYFSMHSRYFKLLLQRSKSVVRIAALTDAPDTVLGWSLMEAGVLHYVWVGGDYRRTGIASALLPDPFDTITNITRFFLPIWQKKYPHANFNPYQGAQ